jgi:flagellar biosynthetic protein FliQ
VNALDLHVTELARELLWTTLVISAPILLVGLVVGIVVSLFQALTSVQEQTLAQIPKLLAVMVAAALLLAPALELLRDYAERVFAQLVSFGLS